MSLPFSTEAFFEVMRRYNEGVWPAQAAFLFGLLEDLGLPAAGAAAVWFTLVSRRQARFA